MLLQQLLLYTQAGNGKPLPALGLCAYLMVLLWVLELDFLSIKLMWIRTLIMLVIINFVAYLARTCIVVAVLWQ